MVWTADLNDLTPRALADHRHVAFPTSGARWSTPARRARQCAGPASSSEERKGPCAGRSSGRRCPRPTSIGCHRPFQPIKKGATPVLMGSPCSSDAFSGLSSFSGRRSGLDTASCPLLEPNGSCSKDHRASVQILGNPCPLGAFLGVIVRKSAPGGRPRVQMPSGL